MSFNLGGTSLMTSSSNTFTTLSAGTQAQIVHDLMDLFRSNERGYGIGEFEGARFDEEKGKWYPGHVRWTWGKTENEQWRAHLAGERLLGQGVLCDDNRVWYACLDIDEYEIDYHDEMRKVKGSKLPLVVFRTKSSGLRITVFFSEPIEAEVVIPRMRRVASLLGYAGCEVFPKQTKLIVEKDDCPSWIYVPFGGTHEIFAEQGCMTDNGGLMDLGDAVEHCKVMRINRAQFMDMFSAEEAQRTNGKVNGKKHPQGSWVEEMDEATTINTMYHDGPVCLWIIAHARCTSMQNGFLINSATFLKRKYPENWDKALDWVNYHILQPVGDREKLSSIIKRFQNKDYEYTCHDAPIVSHCDPHGCRLKKYGVGKNGSAMDFSEMGMTIVKRDPRIFIISVDETRIVCEHTDIVNQSRFIEKCVAAGLHMPARKKTDDWTMFVNKNMDSATYVEPSQVMRTGASELEFFTKWLSIIVPTYMRIGEREDDEARLIEKEKRIYFKPKKLLARCRMLNFDEDKMRRYIDAKCTFHDRTTYRGWFRSTYSAPFDLFDEEDIEPWLAAGGTNDSGSGVRDAVSGGGEGGSPTE